MLGGLARLVIAINAKSRKIIIQIGFILLYYQTQLTQMGNYHQHYYHSTVSKNPEFLPPHKAERPNPLIFLCCHIPIFLTVFLTFEDIIPEDLLQQMNQVIEQVGNYRILKSHPLGSGATGAVFYGQNKSGIKVAVKSIDIKKINKGIEKQIENEIKNLTALQSPFIVKLYDYFRSGENIYMVLEYCEDGDLKNYLEKNRKNQGLSEAEAQTFMRHLTQGYLALLKQNIIHRDIKPANILLKQGVAKLSDFGFSRVVEDPNKTQKLTLLGTPLYTAPQILANKEFSNKCDVWSMGVVFYEMLHGRTPWTGTDLENLRTNIEKKKLEWKPNINPEIKNLISKMLQIKTDERIRWEELLTFPLFAKPIDLGIQKQKMETSFPQALKILMEYLKNFLVKSYLIIDTNNEVNFAPSQQPLETPQKSQDQLQVEKETNYLTRRRNFAFLHMYVLALYQKNRAIIPKDAKVNQFMELEYGLIKKAYDLIMTIGEDFNLNNTKGEKRWQNYKKTPQYAELNALLSNDFKLLDLLLRSCKATIVERLAKNTLPPQTKEIYEKYEKKFDKVFKDAMMSNANELAKVNVGVCRLLQDYLVKYILSPEQILENNQLDLASNYEKREKDYNLE